MFFGVLGAIEARHEGRTVGLGHARQRCVLAALLVDANRVVPTDQLVDRVWAGHPPQHARRTLYVYLSHLRRALIDMGIEIHRQSEGYLLSVDADSVDMHRFRTLLARARADKRGDKVSSETGTTALEEALGLWRGEAFAGVDTPWFNSQRELLLGEWFVATLDLYDARLRRGDHSGVLPQALDLSSAHPLDERLAGQVMLALQRSGRQAEALNRYERLRLRLADELGADPGPELRQLHGRLLEGDSADLASPPPERSPADRAQRVVPRQLPPAPAHFAGRAAEIAQLTAALDESTEEGGTVLVSALAGAGGVGKTWLALQWAHRVRDRFPDGQLFVDLRGFSSHGPPMDSAVAMRGFLEALGADTRHIPTDPHAQAALYRSLMAERRRLVVLDNAATADQIVPLLPGSRTCTVVVTSRRTLPTLISRHGAQNLRLAPLTTQDVHDLLTARLGAQRIAAEPGAVADLIELCRGYALALGLIAGRAHARPDIPLAHLAAELHELGLAALDDEDPAASLPAVLSWSYQVLSPEQQTVFGLLGLAPGTDIGTPAAAHLTGLSTARSKRALRVLEDASLLAYDAHGRYSMHDLIRAYATDTAHRRLPGPTRQAALRRVVDFYLHTSHAADRVLDPHRHPTSFDFSTTEVCPRPPSDDPAAMAWFHTEHANLLAAQQTATAHGWHDTVCRLAWTLSTFHFRRGYRDDDLAIWQAAVASGAHLTDPTTRSLSHRLLGRAYANLGRHGEALEHLHHALAVANAHHDLSCQGYAHRALAWTSRQIGDDRRAMEHAGQALDIFRATDQPVMEARTLNGTGWYAAHLGDHDTARTYCEAALALQQHHHDPSGKANTLDSLAYIDHGTGRHREAIDHYRQALALYRELGYTSHAADTLDRISHPYTALGRHDHARTARQEALELYRQQGRDEDAARVRTHLTASAAPDSAH
ncbi:transcriptional regulator, SARP family protein [Streptomyces diacarni]|uniref:Transcriptional regulator, SARP family protein n=1 Tax=Streptomyces diacarni TaxID=2800381 RepID=A0A367ELN1_9ACTN|nr:BTAD domain-containing putative transcriptional regulator [Streptomyces diacarni]RCG18931.1 transcriptional regulator, SARP family protein [Streptomyces diacarni]